MGSNEYALFIPIFDEDKQIVSIMKYSTAGDHGHFSHKSSRKIKLIAEEDDINDISGDFISFILKLAVYEHYLYDGASSILISALTKYIEANPDKIYTRSTSEFYVITWSNLVNNTENVRQITLEVIASCNEFDGSPGGGGEIIDDIDGIPIGGGGVKLTPIKKVLDKYSSFAELADCIYEHASSNVINFILKGIDDLKCLSISEEELFDALKVLCDEHSESVSFSNIEGNNSSGASFDLDDLKELLPMDDHIIIEKSTYNCSNNEPPLSMDDDCKKLANLLDATIGENGAIPHCDLLKSLGSAVHTVRYFWDCDNNFIEPRMDGTYPNAQTQPKFIEGEIKIYFGPEICNKDCIEILSHIIHESIHAKVYSVAFDKLPPELDGKFPSVQAALNVYNDIKNEEFNGVTNLHEIMAEYYAFEYAKAMHQMIGEGEVEDYLYWAYHGLGINPEEILGADEWLEIENDWNDIETQVNLNCE